MNCEGTYRLFQINAKFSATQTVAETLQNIFRSYGKFLENEVGHSIDPEQYVLKFRGLEEYLLDLSDRLINIETIRKRLRKKLKIELILAERSKLSVPNWEKITDFYEQVNNE